MLREPPAAPRPVPPTCEISESPLESREKTEDRRQKTEDRRQKTEDRSRMCHDRGKMSRNCHALHARAPTPWKRKGQTHFAEEMDAPTAARRREAYRCVPKPKLLHKPKLEPEPGCPTAVALGVASRVAVLHFRLTVVRRGRTT